MDVTLINLPETVSVALMVIGGKFGNGDDRKTTLEKCGYDYETVQACVNRLVPIINDYS